MSPSEDSLAGLGVTAILVAGARAAESARADGLFDDPFARAFIDAASALSPAVQAAMAQASVDETVNQARRDAIAVRTRFCDDYLLAAAHAGCHQVVLLAAGLDARAFRLAWPPDVRVWELDAPGVLAFKTQVLAERGATPRSNRVALPVDLADDWPAALLGAGFVPAEPTAWLLEGLLMYLDERARDRLLDRLGALSARGSRLALDHRPGFFAPPPVAGRDDAEAHAWAARFAALAAAAGSDPSLVDPSGWLRRHGWRAVVEDAAAVLLRYGRAVPASLHAVTPGAPRAWLAVAERM